MKKEKMIEGKEQRKKEKMKDAKRKMKVKNKKVWK